MASPGRLWSMNFSESVSKGIERQKKAKGTLTSCENIDRHSKKDPES